MTDKELDDLIEKRRREWNATHAALLKAGGDNGIHFNFGDAELIRLEEIREQRQRAKQREKWRTYLLAAAIFAYIIWCAVYG